MELESTFKELAEGKINGIKLGYDVVNIIKTHYYNYEKIKKLNKLHDEYVHKWQKCLVCNKSLFFKIGNFYCDNCMRIPAHEDHGMLNNTDINEINIRYLFF